MQQRAISDTMLFAFLADVFPQQQPPTEFSLHLWYTTVITTVTYFSFPNEKLILCSFLLTISPCIFRIHIPGKLRRMCRGNLQTVCRPGAYVGKG